MNDVSVPCCMSLMFFFGGLWLKLDPCHAGVFLSGCKQVNWQLCFMENIVSKDWTWWIYIIWKIDVCLCEAYILTSSPSTTSLHSLPCKPGPTSGTDVGKLVSTNPQVRHWYEIGSATPLPENTEPGNVTPSNFLYSVLKCKLCTIAMWLQAFLYLALRCTKLWPIVMWLHPPSCT